MLKLSAFLFLCFFAKNMSAQDREITTYVASDLLWLFTNELDQLKTRHFQLQSQVNENVVRILDKANKDVQAELLRLKNSVGDYHLNVSKTVNELAMKGPCETGWQYFQGHCYYYGVDRRNWSDAKNDCLARKSYLVQVDNKEENDWLKIKATQHTWIGAHDSQVEGQWRWVSDNSLLSFTAWAKDEPNNRYEEDCAHFNNDAEFYWNDSRCVNKFAYFCERNSQ